MLCEGLDRGIISDIEAIFDVQPCSSLSQSGNEVNAELGPVLPSLSIECLAFKDCARLRPQYVSKKKLHSPDNKDMPPKAATPFRK